MARQLEGEEFMLKYLLNELSQESREALELRFFTDDDYYARLTALEDDLIQDYLSGTLSADLASRIDAGLENSPSLKRKLHEARALLQCLPEVQSQG
ncbi:MAG TPA: hypothetical protein VER98_12650, partial [Terriglobia bacterium]|nr:hypothetical protein [Terriglobia bacterium]